MSIERIVEFEGETHLYSSDMEGDTYLDCDEWVSTQTDEMKDAWHEFQRTGTHTELAVSVYNQWLITCKITHTIKDGDTVRISNSYKDLI